MTTSVNNSAEYNTDYRNHSTSSFDEPSANEAISHSSDLLRSDKIGSVLVGSPRGTSSINIELAKMISETSTRGNPKGLEKVEPLKELPNMVFYPEENKNWSKIASFDPKGFIPDNRGNVSIASTPVYMKIPEITEALKKGTLIEDGTVIKDGHIQALKIAIDYTYCLEEMSKRLNSHLDRDGKQSITEDDIRTALHQATQAPGLLNEETKLYQPPIDGPSVYIFGDPEKIGLDVETTVRIQNSCESSDVFHSDICSCRPNLMFGLEEAVKTAQEGGVGIIAYVHKEGRGLGQVPKFTVYNVRHDQIGGDDPDLYFDATRQVMQHLTGSAIKDSARSEIEGPDIMLWLGVNKITRFITDNRAKAAGMEREGIQIDELVPMPLDRIPRGALTEMTAKGSVDSATMKYQSSEAATSPSRLVNCFSLTEEGLSQLKNAIIFGLLSYMVVKSASPE